jgi:hypothetical protein
VHPIVPSHVRGLLCSLLCSNVRLNSLITSVLKNFGNILESEELSCRCSFRICIPVCSLTTFLSCSLTLYDELDEIQTLHKFRSKLSIAVSNHSRNVKLKELSVMQQRAQMQPNHI